jgi:hypothetical protein
MILKTTNGGVNWVFQKDVAGGSGLYTIDFVNENTGWVAGDYTNGSNVLYTTNGGLNWNETTVPAGGRITKVQFVNNSTGWVVGSNNKVFKTTNAGGLLTSVNTNSGSLPKNFVLFQNNPNPFNPVTKFKFDLPASPLYERGDKGGFITLRIFDILGREVAVLVNEQYKPGTYEVEWDASYFPSGIYYYKLETGDYSETKKMILVK